MDEMVDAVNNLAINDAKYYESNTKTTSNTQIDFTHNTETITHTINENETVTHTNNRN